MAIHGANQKFRFTIWKGGYTLLSSHDFFDHILCPCTLRLIKNGDTLRRYVIVPYEGVTVLVDDLNERRSATQGICFRNTITSLPLLFNLIACECFLQYRYQREVTRQEHRMLTLLGIGALNCNIQTN